MYKKLTLLLLLTLITLTPQSTFAEEALWVLWRCEDPGFGQTGAGWDGIDSPESHQNFVKQQLDERFGTIHNLLKSWGTFDYDGY
mgnify:CR=1 FL=1